MRFRAFVVATAMGAWLAGLAGAQTPEGMGAGGDEAMADTSRLTVEFKMMQNGAEVTTVDKGTDVEVIATVNVNMPDATEPAIVQVVLGIEEELAVDNSDHVRIRQQYVDETGDGVDWSPQASAAPRKRLKFSPAEDGSGIVATKQVKWAMSFRENAANAPFAAAATLAMQSSPGDIVIQDRAEIRLKVKTAMNVQQLWHDGGAFMWPLGILLVLAIAFALERVFTLTLAKIDAQKFFAGLSDVLKKDGAEKAIEYCNKARGPVPGVMREGLMRVNQGVAQVEKAIESAGAIEGSFLQRGMVVIASVVALAPMFGFLGTVWGMVLAFKAIAEAGDVKPSVVANGISQALITTATGLLIGIIAQSLHNFLISRINRIVIDMEETSTLLIDLLIEEGMDEKGASQ